MTRRKASPCYSDEEMEEDIPNRKRIRGEENVEGRLESLVYRIGCKGLQTIESDVDGLSKVLQSDIPNYKERFLRILVKSAKDVPERMTIFVTLVGLLNVKNYSFGGEFVELLVRELKDNLKTYKLDNARFIIRFLCDLVNCSVVAAGSIFMLYENLLEVLQEDNTPHVRSDWCVYTVLYSLPWVGKALSEHNEATLKDILDAIESYLRKRTKHYITGMRVWDTGDPHTQEDYLDCLWAQICSLRRQQWVEKVTWRLYYSFTAALEASKPHKLPLIAPPAHNEEAVYPLPRVIFRLFDYTDIVCEDAGSSGLGSAATGDAAGAGVASGLILPGAHTIERFMVEDQLTILIDALWFDRKMCAKTLSEFPARVRLPIKYMIVEVAFGEMFRLPRSPHRLIYYGVLLIELCKEMSTTMPQILAQATEMLFERLATMHPICIDRFACWFAYHLSNYKFQWSWDEWLDAVQLDVDHPKARFLAESAQRLMRFSYYEYIARVMPKQLASLLPKMPRPWNKYDKEGSIASEELAGLVVAQNLTQAIRGKCTQSEAMAVLKGLDEEGLAEKSGSEKALYPGVSSLAIDVFFSVLFNLGNKTYSHVFSLIDKFGSLIRALAANVSTQVELLHCLYGVCRDQQQTIVIIADRLVRDGYIQHEAVAKWIYSPEMADNLTQFYVWEIMSLTLNRMGARVDQISKDIEDTKESFDSRSSKSRDQGMIDMGGGSSSSARGLEQKLTTLRDKQTETTVMQGQLFEYIVRRHGQLIIAGEQGVRGQAWLFWIVGRFRQMLLEHHQHLQRYTDIMEQLCNEADSVVVQQVIREFLSLRS